jgi:kynurenine formamidase
MEAIINHNSKKYKVDFSKPLDISMPLTSNENATRAWYANAISIEPVRMGTWVGSVKEGNSVNFKNIFFNPHAHGTHTECVGHISADEESINATLTTFMFFAELISVEPEKINGDSLITKEQLMHCFDNKKNVEALIIRTKPNGNEKLHINYSNTNPTYIDKTAIEYLNEKGIKHLLIDLPSVDREKDDGVLAAHKAFWQFPHNTQHSKTITEMIYAAVNIQDGLYLLNLQIAPFENDASPSKPILYSTTEI